MAEKAAPGSPWQESDDFERPDGELGADWALRYLWVQPPDAGVVVKGGEMQQFGDDEVEATWLHPCPSDDMRVEVTVGTLVATNYTLQVRGALDSWPTIEASMGTTPPPPGQGMEPYMGPKIVKKNSSSDGGVGLANSPWEAPLVPGQRLSFECVGTDYSFKVDGVEKVSWSGADMPTGANNRLVRVSISSSSAAGKPESTLDDFLVTDLGPLLPVEYTPALAGLGTLTATAADVAEPEPPVEPGGGGGEAVRATIRIGRTMWFANDVYGAVYACGAVGEPITFSATVAPRSDGTEETSDPSPVTDPGVPVRVAIRIGGTIWFADDVYEPVYSSAGEGGTVTFSATVAPRGIDSGMPDDE